MVGSHASPTIQDEPDPICSWVLPLAKEVIWSALSIQSQRSSSNQQQKSPQKWWQKLELLTHKTIITLGLHGLETRRWVGNPNHLLSEEGLCRLVGTFTGKSSKFCHRLYQLWCRIRAWGLASLVHESYLGVMVRFRNNWKPLLYLFSLCTVRLHVKMCDVCKHRMRHLLSHFLWMFA